MKKAFVTINDKGEILIFENTDKKRDVLSFTKRRAYSLIKKLNDFFNVKSNDIAILYTIQEDVCSIFNIPTLNDISHKPDYAIGRYVYYYIAREITNFSYAKIAIRVGRKSSSAILGMKYLNNLIITKDSNYYSKIQEAFDKYELKIEDYEKEK